MDDRLLMYFQKKIVNIRETFGVFAPNLELKILCIELVFEHQMIT